MSRDRHRPDDDEISAFRQALREAGVRPIRANRADPGRPRRDDPSAEARRAAAQAANEASGTGRTSDGRVEAVRFSEALEFALPDLPWRERSRLKRGDYAWEAGLDLHGYTLEEARTELEGFLREAAARRQRCAGGPRQGLGHHQRLPGDQEPRERLAARVARRARLLLGHRRRRRYRCRLCAAAAARRTLSRRQVPASGADSPAIGPSLLRGSTTIPRLPQPGWSRPSKRSRASTARCRPRVISASARWNS